MAKKQIDKKALDAEITNALLDDFDKFEHLALTHWKKIILICVLVVVAVAVVGTVIAVRQSADKKMVAALVNAKTIDEIAQALKEYPDSQAAIGARLQLAALYRNDKKYTEAIDVLKQVESNSEVPSEMRYRVQLDVCYLTELSGDKKGAAEKFVAIGSNTFIPEDFRCEANYSAGRIYSDLKDYTNAVKYLGKAKNAVAITKDGGNMTIYFWQGLAKSLYELLPDSAIAAVMKAGEPKAPQDKQ